MPTSCAHSPSAASTPSAWNSCGGFHSKVRFLASRTPRAGLLVTGLLVILPGILRAEGNDCQGRWQQALRALDQLAISQDKQAGIRLLLQFVAESDRSNPTCPYLPEALDQLGSLEEDQGKYQNAEKHYRQAIKLLENRSTADAELAYALNNLASVYLRTGRPKQGEPLRRRSLELRLLLFGENHPEVALAYINLAADLFQEKKYAEAEECTRKALVIWETHAPQDGRISVAYGSLAIIFLRQKNYGQAVGQALRAIRIQKQKDPSDPQWLARFSHTLAVAYEKQNLLEESGAAFQQALDQLATLRTPNLNLKADVLEDYSRLLTRLGSRANAKDLARQAHALRSEANSVSGLGYSIDIKDLAH